MSSFFDIVQDVRKINHKSINDIQSIAASAEQLLASMQQVASSVGVIERTSGELAEVIRE